MRRILKPLFAIVVLALSIVFGQACAPFGASPALQLSSGGQAGSIHEPEIENSTRLLGLKLYSQHCSSCHGDIDSSTKRDRNLAQITAARLSVPVMKTPEITALTEAELEAISIALRSTLPVGANPFTCDPDLKNETPRLQRLAKSEYQNTIRDLFFGVVNVADLQDVFAQLPEEANLDNPFDRGADTLSLGHVKAHNQIAIRVASLVSQDPNRLNRVFNESCWSAASVTDACLISFLNRFGLQVFRRPVKASERAPLIAAYRLGANRAEGSALLLRALLMSPNFLYHLEYDGTPTDAEASSLKLDSYELASKLSYLIVNSMPDAELLSAAASGSLLTPNGYNTQMNRLLLQPQARASLRRFVYKWFELDRAHDQNYSAAFKNGIVTTGLDAAALEEALLFSDHVIFEGKRAEHLLTDKTAFLKSATLAQLYGVTMPTSADGRTTLPTGERAGLLTRIAKTVSGSDNTSPIERGVAVRRSLLCDSLSAPDPNSLPPGSLNAPLEDPLLSTRKRFENKTSPAACVGCHEKINPIGFALESYDSLGRYRLSENVLNSSGQVLAQHPIDDRVSIELSSPPATDVRGGVELSHAVAGSWKYSACFSRRWFQFADRRTPSAGDNCRLAKTYETLRNPSTSLLDAIKTTITDDAFKARRMK